MLHLKINEMSASNNNEEDSDIISFDNTFQLKLICKKSNSEVWKYFGILVKTDIIVKRFQDRILCKVCFGHNQVKRYYNKIYCCI